MTTTRYAIYTIDPATDAARTATVDSLGQLLATRETAQDAKEYAEANAQQSLHGTAIHDRVEHTIDWGNEVTPDGK